MQMLRSKVFKRVKPKALNKKQLNGEMLLRLCHAYTEAINKGSVPCIENAWYSICKNENLKTVKECLAAYDASLAGLLRKMRVGEGNEFSALRELHKE